MLTFNKDANLNTSYVIVYQSRKLIILLYTGDLNTSYVIVYLWDIKDKKYKRYDLNTSSVIVYQREQFVTICRTQEFKYILCYCLSRYGNKG